MASRLNRPHSPIPGRGQEVPLPPSHPEYCRPIACILPLAPSDRLDPVLLASPRYRNLVTTITNARQVSTTISCILSAAQVSQERESYSAGIRPTDRRPGSMLLANDRRYFHRESVLTVTPVSACFAVHSASDRRSTTREVGHDIPARRLRRTCAGIEQPCCDGRSGSYSNRVAGLHREPHVVNRKVSR